MEQTDVIIVGGGLAGLTAAAILSKAGKQVILIEQSVMLGGRAQTQTDRDFLFNLGPHALYKNGIAARVYRELNLSLSGGEPTANGAHIYSEGKLYPLAASLLGSQILTWSEKWELVRKLRQMATLNPPDLTGQSLADWLTTNTHSPKVGQFLQAVLRLCSYCADLELLDAGLALAQFQLSLGNVQYLNGGWQTIVNELVRVSQQAGTKMLTGRGVKQVEIGDLGEGKISVELDDGRKLAATHLVLTTPPATVSHLTGLKFETVPIRAACLDVGLRHLPMPNRQFGLFLDRPCYYSVHSACGKLAPSGGALIHVARYLRHDEDIPSAHLRTELEALLDLIQPGWQQEIVRDRFMPQLVVAYDLPRSTTIASGIPNLHLAGDWVGNVGMLSDRAVASAERVSQAILKSAGAETAIH